MVRGSFAAPMQIYVIFLVFLYSHDYYASLDSQRRMLYNNLIYLNVGHKIEL